MLRLGLGNSTAEEENLADFIMLSAAQWAKIGDIAQEQGVMGIVLDGIDSLEATGCGATRELSKEQKLQWIGVVLQNYEAGNRQQMAVIDAVQRRWAEHGLRTMIMKGQAMGTYYPKPEHRSPGDIDCYLINENENQNQNQNENENGSGYRIGNEVARTFADKVDEGWYKHSQIFYGGQMIENHQYFVHTREGKSSKRLNQLLVDELRVESLEFRVLPGTGALLPPPMFNALFLTYHAMTHFLEEGLKLKQVLDWAMFLKKDGDKVDWEEFYRICDKFHLRRFADVMNTIAKQYFNVNDNKNENENENLDGENPYAEKVLHSTFYDKDYVFSSGEGGWKNRWHIVRNLWKYRWKYHQIYQHSIVRQLWFYASGYLFKTE